MKHIYGRSLADEIIKTQKRIDILNHLKCSFSKGDLQEFFDGLEEEYIEKHENSKLVCNLTKKSGNTKQNT